MSESFEASCCGGSGAADAVGHTRRALLRGSVLGGLGLAAAGVLGACSSPGAAGVAPPAAADDKSAKLRLVLLGTSAGPPYETGRMGIASALVVDGAVYVIDCGRGALNQFKLAGLRFDKMRAIFLTHLHADHVMDYYNFFLSGGFGLSGDHDLLPPIKVYGPGPAGALPQGFNGAKAATVNPANPTPGTAEMTDYCHDAYAYSSNCFIRDTGIRDPRTLSDVHEIAVPASVGAGPLTNTAPPMQPIPVMEDDRVKVSAVLVPHGPVFPSFAFRFDTDHGSVTFSGDTIPTDNLVTLARSSQVLVHEAISDPTKAGLPKVAASHMLKSHTVVSDTGKIAQRADVPQLVLSHIGDLTGNLDEGVWTGLAKQGYGGNVVIGKDLLSVPVVKK